MLPVHTKPGRLENPSRSHPTANIFPAQYQPLGSVGTSEMAFPLPNISPLEEANHTSHRSTNTSSIYFLTFSAVHSCQLTAPFLLFSCCPNSLGSSLPASLTALLQSHQNGFFLNSQLLANWTHWKISTKLQLLFPAIFLPPSPSNSQIQHPAILVFLLKAAMIAPGQNYPVISAAPQHFSQSGLFSTLLSAVKVTQKFLWSQQH